MELSSGKCTLCKYELNVFSKNTDLFIKQIQYAFFATNKGDYSQEFSTKLALCVICCQKLQISFDFKNSYDQMCNRNHRSHKNKCFFCENKMHILVHMDEIMSECNEKLKVFLNSVIVYHNYGGLSACTKCIYGLSIWWEIRTCIYSLMNLPENSSISKTAMENNVYSTPTIKRSPRQTVLSKYSSRNKQRLRLSTLREMSKKRKWKIYLTKRLEDIKTTNEIIKFHNLSFEDVDEIFSDKLDDKLFNQKVYVSISIKSQISPRVLQKLNAYETIIINDSDDEGISSPTSNAADRENENSKNSSTPHNKTPVKIKFSSSFSKSLTLRPKYTYTCAVCDKGFSVRCDYLLHLLKHEKMESLIINVTRYKLPTEIKVDKFENLHWKENKMSLPAKSINQLLVKWVGEHAADTFDESDKENGKNVNNTVDETAICNNITEMVEEDNGNGERNVISDDNTKLNNSVVGTIMTQIDTDHSNKLTKNTNDNHSSELFDENCQTEIAGSLEPSEERLSETTTCDQNVETDRDGNLEPNIEDNSGGHTENESDKIENESDKIGNENDKIENENDIIENQNEVEVEFNNIEESTNGQINISGNNENVQDVAENVTDQNVSQDKCEIQENEPNFTNEETNILENASETARKSTTHKNISLSLQKPKKIDISNSETYEEFSSNESNITPSNTKIVSCEELLSILEGDDDCSEKDKTTEKFTQCSNEESVPKDVGSVGSISSDEVDENVDNGSIKRKRMEDELDETPKRKRVRFASEKVIMTPDKSILLEKVSEGDDIVVDE